MAPLELKNDESFHNRVTSTEGEMRRVAIRRIFFSILSAALIPACGEVGGGAASTSIFMTPGSTSGSSAPGTANAGGAGFFAAYSRGNIHFGQISPPKVPTLPPAPTTGTVVTTAMLAALPPGFGADGNLLISGNVTTPGTGLTTIIASVGDIVVSGSLQSGGLATPDKIDLNAPSGTIYVSGGIRSSLGLGAGASGGSITLTARRIIITGSIDSGGDANAAGDGGQGGAVTLDTTLTASGTSIYALGSMRASGGTGTTRTASGRSDAGIIVINANDEAWLGGSVTAKGADVHGVAGALTSGSGGTVYVNASSGVFILSSIDLSAGNVSTSGTGTGNGVAGDGTYGTSLAGGQGGNLNINTTVGAPLSNPSGPVYVFGSITSNGGSASSAAGTAAAPIDAGDCGSVTIGTQSNGAPVSIDFGSADIHLPGGNSGDAATQGGFVNIQNGYPAAGGAPYAGDIVFSGLMDLTNGEGGNSTGNASSLTFQSGSGDIFLSGSIKMGGGSASGDLSVAGFPFFTAESGGFGAGGVFSSASITADGPRSSAGKGGQGGVLWFKVNDATSGISLLPGTVLSANGGAGGGAAGTGGTGGLISLQTSGNSAGSGTISVSGTLTAVGGSSGVAGGPGGEFYVDSCLSASGPGGDVRLETGSLVDVSGGTGAPGGSARNNGGGLSTATRTPFGSSTCSVEIWTHGSGITPAEPAFPVAAGGRLINNGTIRANGASSNGSGGDMNIDAFQSDGSGAVTLGTLGNVSNAGSGTGSTGIITVH